MRQQKVRIYVKERHLATGVRQTCDRCPIILAVNDATGREWYWTLGTLQPKDRRQRALIRLPPYAIRAMADIDLGRPVQPFDFEVTIHLTGD
jgi:hypothetical protein